MASLKTVVVEFNGGDSSDDYIFNIDTDSVLNVDENGDSVSSFYPGDSVFIEVNKSSNIGVLDVICTEGNIGFVGVGSRSSIENVFFPSEEDVWESSLSISGSEYSAVGREGQYAPAINHLGVLTITPVSTPFILKVSMSYDVDIYKLDIPADIEDEHEIGIVFNCILI